MEVAGLAEGVTQVLAVRLDQCHWLAIECGGAGCEAALRGRRHRPASNELLLVPCQPVQKVSFGHDFTSSRTTVWEPSPYRFASGSRG